MQDNCMPKKVLFGWLSKPRSPRRRWRDLASCDLKYLDLNCTHFYEAALSRQEWRSLCSDGLKVAQHQQSRQPPISQSQVQCYHCQRSMVQKKSRQSSTRLITHNLVQPGCWHSLVLARCSSHMHVGGAFGHDYAGSIGMDHRATTNTIRMV